jgi:hypothetical protein
MMLLVCIEFDRMLLVYSTLADSARAGARYAIVHGNSRSGTGVDGPSGPTACTDTPPTQIVTVIKNFASAGTLESSKLNVQVCYLDGTNTPGSRVTVWISYPYAPFVGYFSVLNLNFTTTTAGVIDF